MVPRAPTIDANWPPRPAPHRAFGRHEPDVPERASESAPPPAGGGRGRLLRTLSPRPLQRVGGCLGAGAACGVGLLGGLLVARAPEATLAGGDFLAAAFAACVYAAILLVATRNDSIACHEEGLEVRSKWRRVFVRWGDIHGVRRRPWMGSLALSAQVEGRRRVLKIPLGLYPDLPILEHEIERRRAAAVHARSA